MSGLASTPRTLIIGAGCMGRFVAEACLDAGIPTYILIRSTSNSPSKTETIKALQNKGAVIVHGCIEDQPLLEKILREHKIEVVISTVVCFLEQLHLVEAIKAVGTVKRFLPSEFGHDVDRVDPVEPALSLYKIKKKVRTETEKAGIPYTYICCNSIAGWPYHDNVHPSEVLPPLDAFKIYGDGTVKGDNGERAVNKTIHFRPKSNMFNVNELASLWEKKIGRTLPRKFMTEEDLLTAVKELPLPGNVVSALTHDIFIKGCQVRYSLDKPADIDVCSLYPDTPFQSMDECFDEFIAKFPEALRAPSHN
nr:leucoanthocyanidin reductase-like protein [Morus alba var. atropurpurea]